MVRSAQITSASSQGPPRECGDRSQFLDASCGVVLRCGMAVLNRRPIRLLTLPQPWHPLPVAVDLHTTLFDLRFEAAPELRKDPNEPVNARCATDREWVVTRLKDGQKETGNWAEVGDWIITNPGGEEYVVSPEVFRHRFTPVPDSDLFQPVGISRIVPNLTGYPVRIMAPWGQEQFGAPDCLFAMAVGPGGGLTANRYIIGVEELAETYERPRREQRLQLNPQARLHWLNSGESLLKSTVKSPPQPNPGRRGKRFPDIQGPGTITTFSWPKGGVGRT